MHAPASEDAARLAYVAAAQAFAAMAVRNLWAIEGDDPDVRSVVVACADDGHVSVTLRGATRDLGGYSL